MKVLTLCRTSVTFDVNNPEDPYHVLGRGNLAPHTIGLPLLALRAKKEYPNNPIDGFRIILRNILSEAEESLMLRYNLIAKQPPSVAPFMYENGSMLDGEKCKENVEKCMKHNTLAIGYIGIAEACKVLTGHYHCETEEARELGKEMVKTIYDFCNECTKKHHLNFSCYATPAESLCKKVRNAIVEQYGIIEGVSDREYVTNSHHVPVWFECDPFFKADIESDYAKLATGGNIFHIEVDTTNTNLQAITTAVEYALSKDIPYIRLSHKTSTCRECGYHVETLMDKCENCGSEDIEVLATVTGYLTTSVDRMNSGKRAEVSDRVVHNGLEKDKFQ